MPLMVVRAFICSSSSVDAVASLSPGRQGEHCDVMWCANLLCRYFSRTRYPLISSSIRFSSSCYTLVLWNSITTSSSRLMPTLKITLPANFGSSRDDCKLASRPRSLAPFKALRINLSPLNPPRIPTPSRMFLSWTAKNEQERLSRSKISLPNSIQRAPALSRSPSNSSARSMHHRATYNSHASWIFSPERHR
ncbi:hypothetical protein DFH06DRAFT_1245913, partial [Mycena polygramma]